MYISIYIYIYGRPPPKDLHFRTCSKINVCIALLVMAPCNMYIYIYIYISERYAPIPPI